MLLDTGGNALAATAITNHDEDLNETTVER